MRVKKRAGLFIFSSVFIIIQICILILYPIVSPKVDEFLGSSTFLSLWNTDPPMAFPVEVTIYAGENPPPEDFVTAVYAESAVTIRFADQPDFDTPGTSEVTVTITDASGNKTEVVSTLAVMPRKTSPPKGQAVEVYCQMNELVPPEAFVTGIVDETVTIEYIYPPDTSFLGWQDVIVRLTDDLGNYNDITSWLIVKENDVKPRIMGAKNLFDMKGFDSDIYTRHVYAVDNCGRKLKVEAESTVTDTMIPGEYQVTYKTVDVSKNRAEKTVKLTVSDIEVQDVYADVDEILGRIIKPDMNTEKKIAAIFDWVRKNLSYSPGNYSDDVVFGSYTAMKKKCGDCFIFNAISEAMFTRAGIEFRRVVRINGRTEHYWSLVNVDGLWYFYDATPRIGAGNPKSIFGQKALTSVGKY